jgi:hypothetical protein
MKSKSLLAKLLSKENIIVHQGNYETAFFDLEQRILGLPLWEEFTSDTTDLLIGHEVGHALHTPIEGLHSFLDAENKIPKSFMNIIEDIRIEKLIQRDYIGLVPCFKRGYKALHERDFFKIADKDVQKMSFMNRLNLKSKLRDDIVVEFSEEEQPYLKMAMAVETWDDVVRACEGIYNYLKSKQDENERPESPKTKGEELDSKPFNDTQESTSGEYTLGNDQCDDLESDGSSGTELEEEIGSDDELEDEMDTSTDENFRESEREMSVKSPNDNIPLVIHSPTDKQVDEIIVRNEAVIAQRNSILKELIENKEFSEYRTFLDETNKIVKVMVREFEMRKCAYQHSRAKTSKSGTLNLKKLHEYKFSEDIFNSITTLANVKSHGMIMLMDRSYSMHEILHEVARQTITLAMFCRKANIPFEVYTFASFGRSAIPEPTIIPYHLDVKNVGIVEVLSSRFNKKEFELACKSLFLVTNGNTKFEKSDLDSMGGTPLNEALLAVPKIIKDFKKKYNTQKLSFTLLSDGEGSTFNYYDNQKESKHLASGFYKNDTYLNFDSGNKLIKIDPSNNYSQFKYQIVKIIKDMGVNTICYYLSQDSVDYSSKIGEINDSYASKIFDDAKKMMESQKFVSYENLKGFNKFFILKSSMNILDTNVGDFDVLKGYSTKGISNAFKKYSSKVKLNRLFAVQYVKTIS